MQRVWQTTDGLNFNTKKEAEEHNINLEIRSIIAESFENENEIDKIQNFLKEKREPIQKYCKAIAPPRKLGPRKPKAK